MSALRKLFWPSLLWLLQLPVLAAADGETESGFDDYVRGSLSVSYETKALTYGFVDADDPILAPAGSLTFFGTFTAGFVFYFDTTDFGDKNGRGDHAWDFWEIDVPAELRHAFTPQEVTWLPTSVELGAGYRYEYHPPRSNCPDTEFWIADASLPDLWLVPRFLYERDVLRDHGTYLNLSVSHEFEIVDGVALKPSLGQGWGDNKRVRGYVPTPDLRHRLNRAGMLDTQLRLTLSWRVCDHVKLAVFVAYSDFLFDRHIRDASRRYIRSASGECYRHSSWNFPCGVSLVCDF